MTFKDINTRMRAGTQKINPVHLRLFQGKRLILF